MDRRPIAPDVWAPLDPRPDESLRAGVATTYSIAASMSALVVVVWLAISVARWQLVEPGGAGLLETCAQVLPVLLLTFAIERVFFERTTSLLATRASTIVAFGSVLLLAGVGEVACLVALAWTGGPPEGLRTIAGLLALAATAGSVTLIVGFAAVRSGVVVDLRAGMRLVLSRAPNEPDPRASVAARIAATLLAVGGLVVSGSVAVVAGAVAVAYAQEADVGTAIAIATVGLLFAVVIALPSVAYLIRDGVRIRARTRFWDTQPPEIHRFSELSMPLVRTLPYAPRQVFLNCFYKLVDEQVEMAAWPARFAVAAQDERLTSAERVALEHCSASLDGLIAEIAAGGATATSA